MCYPLPVGQNQEIADLIERYGQWQVAFGSGYAARGEDNRTFLRVGVGHDALSGDGEMVTLSLADPAGRIAERVRRVMGEAERLARYDDAPNVVTLAEVLSGELDHDDRPRQIAQALEVKPWRRVQEQLHEWAVEDGTAAAQALTIHSREHLLWLLDSYRDLPDGPFHSEALDFYPEPFPAPESVDELGNVGTQEMVLAACRATGVDPGDLSGEQQVTVASTYRHGHFDHWQTVLKAAERQGQQPFAAGGDPDHDPGDSPVERGTAVWDRGTGLITITPDDSLDGGGEPVVLDHGDRAQYLLTDTLLSQGWVTHQGDDDRRSGHHREHQDQGRYQSRVVRCPLPTDHAEHQEEILARYGGWQVEFTGADSPGPHAVLTCTVGETRAAWRTGATVVLEIPDPNRQAAALVRRVLAEATRVARDRDEPRVLSLAELLHGALDLNDRAPPRPPRSRRWTRCTLSWPGWARSTATAAAEASPRSPGYLDWVLHTFRAWPDGAPARDAVACAVCGAVPAEFAPLTRITALDAYLTAHRTAWISHLRGLAAPAQ